MRTGKMDNIVFYGQVVKVGNNFSTKPQQCFSETSNKIASLVKPKNFDIYIQQDYSKNEMVFQTDRKGIEKRIPVTAKASRYIEAAKDTIKEHENAVLQSERAEWEKEQNKAEVKETISLLLLPAILPFMYLAEGVKIFKRTINKMATQLATKKG